MKSCDQFQAELLEHLYGLLDPQDITVLSEHLRSCQPCQAALVRAEKHQKLLAAAAKGEFASVRFDVPAAATASPPEPASLAGPWTGGWVRWAVAAALLLAVAGLGIPATLYWQTEEQVAGLQAHHQDLIEQGRQVAAQHQDRLAQADKEVRAVQSKLQRLALEELEKLQKVQNAILQKQLKMVVVGPEKLEPGAANTYEIKIINRLNQPMPARVDVKVLDQANREVYRAKEMRMQGDYHLSLPRNLPLKPNAKLWLVVSAKGDNDRQGELHEKLSLTAPLYVTHLATDKPMYQPGDIVYFRSLTLERFTLKPAQEDLHLVYTLTKPTGEKIELTRGSSQVVRAQGQNPGPILGPDKQPVRGIGAGEYQIDPNANGGEYTLIVSEASNRFQLQERKFLVNRYEKPRLNKELEFTQKSYGPGDTVVADCKVTRVEGGLPVANQPVTATIQVDGKSYGADGKLNGGPLALRTDAAGTVNVKFRLPPQIDKGESSLAVRFTDGGSVETIVRSIPIVLKKLQVEFFPEGGDLVAGLPSRVYFQARTTLDKPAELKGRIVDKQGRVVTTGVHTLNDPTQPGANQGMGMFELTPKAGDTYELKIDSPAGIQGRYTLPEVETDGMVLQVPAKVTPSHEPIHVVVRSANLDRSLLVGAYCRGRLMAFEHVDAKKNEATDVMLKPESGAGGVYRITAFEERPTDSDRQQLVPRAERLIYRKPAERLNITIKPDKAHYVPGDKVKLECLAKDEQGRPAPAVLMLAVTDKSVIKLADEKTFRTMPTHFLLTSEVRRPEDLEHADFFLSDHAKAADAVDLLLGTQGWRRFAEQDPARFRQRHPQEGDRLLVSIGQLAPTMAPKITDLDQQKIRNVYQEFASKTTALQQQLAQANAQRAAASMNRKALAQLADLKSKADKTKAAYAVAVSRLNSYRQFINKAITVGLPILAMLLLVGGIASLMVGLIRRTMPRALPYVVMAACSILLFGLIETYLVSAPRESSLALAPEQLKEDANRMAWAQYGLKGGQFALREQLQAGDMPKAEGAKPAVAQVPPPPEAPEALRGLPPQNAAAPGGKEAAKAKADFKAQGQLGLERRLADRAGFEKKLGARPANKEGAARKGGALDKASRFAQAKKPALFKENQKRAVAGQHREVPPAVMGRIVMPDMAGRGFGGGFGGVPGPMGQPGMMGMMGGAPMPALAAFDARDQLLRQNLADGLRPFGWQMGYVMPPPPPFVVREYAHLHIHGEANIRHDFAETLYWNPVLVLPDGKAEVSFDLSDSVTTFQVRAAAHTLDGRIGAATHDIESRKPFSLEPKLPIKVTASDKIDLPIAIANNTDQQRTVPVRVEATNLALVAGQPQEQVTLAPNGRIRRVYRFQPSIVEGEAQLHLIGGQDEISGDSVERLLKVVPDGFPVVGAKSDLLEKVARLDQDLVLPQTWVKGTLKFQVAVYPSTLADLQKGLEALLREPCGCFEQTSTSNYPNLLILNYLKETDQAKPEVARKAKELLARGYERLTSFECLNTGQNKREGYEWFGGTAPPHEALTAYGLMEFRDMAKVYDVNKTMLERTRNYLVSRKDGKGGFLRNPRALDTFGRAPDNITTAYIVWALTESGKDDDVTRELDALAAQAQTSKDPYFLALVANSCLNRGRTSDAVAFLTKLTEVQKPDGHLDAAQTSITGSGGRDLQIETTALCLYAWLKAQRPDLFNRSIQSAVKWIGQQRGGYGGFGSTQSTILALKALIAYAQANKKTAEAGDLVLYVGQAKVAAKHFEAGAQDAIILDLANAEKLLKPGKNDVRVELTGKSVFPYTATWSYQTLKPASAADCPVALTTQLDRQTANEGETVRLTTKVENKSGKGQGMTVAIIGLPAGLTLPEDLKQLKDLARLRNNGTEPGPISAFETRGRELILYWRDMAPDKRVEVNLDLICRVPGEYRGPASRAYLYYNADHKFWVEPLQMTIKPKEVP